MLYSLYVSGNFSMEVKMSMGTCKACGNSCSANAKVCPHCGEPDPVPGMDAGALGCLAVGVILMIIGAFAKHC